MSGERGKTMPMTKADAEVGIIALDLEAKRREEASMSSMLISMAMMGGGGMFGMPRIKRIRRRRYDSGRLYTTITPKNLDNSAERARGMDGWPFHPTTEEIDFSAGKRYVIYAGTEKAAKKKYRLLKAKQALPELTEG